MYIFILVVKKEKEINIKYEIIKCGKNERVTLEWLVFFCMNREQVVNHFEMMVSLFFDITSNASTYGFVYISISYIIKYLYNEQCV